MTPAKVREHFANYPFGEPCTTYQLDVAESLLKQPIPPFLRELYLDFDGFFGPTHASFFWPLFEKKRGAGSLVEMNLFLRDDDVFPSKLTSQCLFYGDAGIGSQWGLKTDLPGQVILWSASWGEEFEVVGSDILDVWLEEKRKYEEMPGE